MKVRLVGSVFASLAVALAASACTLASPTHIDVEPSADTGDDDGGTSTKTASSAASPTAAAGGCSGTPTKADLTKLTACGNGKGHCYDKTKVPSPEAFNPCPDASMVCIQDEILEAAGSKLKSCASIIGAGACMNLDLLVVPADVKAQSSALTKDSCEDGQVCVPCKDPRNNNDNPLCGQVGVFDKPCTGGAADGGATPAAGGSTAPAGPGCCTSNGKSNGTCIAAAAIPDAQKDQVSADSCTGGAMCVPTAFISGAPVKCSPLLGSGVCLDKCFNGLLAIAGDVGVLSNDGCGDTEVCIPCFLASQAFGGSVPGCN